MALIDGRVLNTSWLDSLVSNGQTTSLLKSLLNRMATTTAWQVTIIVLIQTIIEVLEETTLQING